MLTFIQLYMTNFEQFVSFVMNIFLLGIHLSFWVLEIEYIQRTMFLKIT